MPINFLFAAVRVGGLAATASLMAVMAEGAVPDGYALAADHHMHIASPAAVRRDSLFCDRIGHDKCGGESLLPSTGADAVRALEHAGIQRGVLLSMAYEAAAPKLGEAPKQIAADTRAENAFVVGQASSSCGRLVTFVSVNPNSANALGEIRYWAHHGGAAGLKLHLANSEFDFSSPRQVANLAAVFRAAGDAHLPIVIHLRNDDPDFGAKDVAIFLHKILPAARGDVVQIAHSGGWGGADTQALSALGAFADAIGQDQGGTANLYFDTAVMPDLPGETASPENIANYVDLMRRIGLKRFLLASDWTKGTDLKDYYAAEKRRLNLTDAEWQQLAGNVAPYLASSGVSDRCSIGRAM